ncbi:P-II family nitrogen regulator [Desulfurivibrio alkaliphilus]|uniref:Nitrogen regulatory protein P-II n=1 Tax=Desulfurivibrio alkaliphilus (strain DSM 19089 / UNIQEM U267 / AHT2) TaxID=589865 RepID=D6Z184_DESAT|nr:P-II family nitrogen regulator [Desulfurivibrio alkaliphilus]ADH85339.1 nitrogen regulatory protein P-II [Desulfurivibrio alkaliphilus AHT 2]
MKNEKKLKMVITIVTTEKTEEVIQALRREGVDGWSITRGRGTSLQSYKELWGMRIEPEKELILTLVPEEMAQKVMNAAVAAGELEKPGNGLSLIIDVENATGKIFG